VVPPDSDRVSRVRPYSGVNLQRFFFFAYGTITLYRATFQKSLAKEHFALLLILQPLLLAQVGLGSSRFARRYSGNLDLISFPPPNEMFQFGGLASIAYVFS
jgi:hypothetical protein